MAAICLSHSNDAILSSMKLRVHAPAALDDIEVSDEAHAAHAHLNGTSALPAAVAPAPSRVLASSPATPPVATAPIEGEVIPANPAAVKPQFGPRIILKRLSNKHRNAISLVLQGKSREDAAAVVGFTPEYITMLLQQPLAREWIAHINKTLEVQLEGMFGKSVQAIADGLNHQDPKTYLAAAKLQLQTTGRLDKEPVDNNTTAEDVVRQILIGVQVNINQQR